MEWWKIWTGIDLSFQNWHKEFDKFWLDHLKVLKTYSLMGCFWTKWIMFDLKKYRGVVFHGTREWSKVWRKTGLRFGKWHEEFGNFSAEHTKVPKFGLLLGLRIQPWDLNLVYQPRFLPELPTLGFHLRVSS